MSDSEKRYNIVIAAYLEDEGNEILILPVHGCHVCYTTIDKASELAKEQSEKRERDYQVFVLNTDRDP